MLVNIHGKNVEITDAMQERVEEKLQFLNKYFDLDDSWRTLVLKKRMNQNLLEQKL